MKTPGSKKVPAGRKPKYYFSETVHPSAKNHSDQPLILGDYTELVDSPDGGTLRFIPPGESVEVGLQIPAHGHPLEAVREWIIRSRAMELKAPEEFDLNRLTALWNLGPEPRIKKEACDSLHLQRVSSVMWDADIHRAIKVWEASNCVGPYPPDVLACLDPDQRLPFLSGPEPIPPEKRWLNVPIDLARPLKEQFDASLGRCDEIRNHAFLLAGQPIPRPGRREDRRNVLIYTLHKSARLTFKQIAKDQFPKEDQTTAMEKVKEIIQDVEEAVRQEGSKQPPLKPGSPE